MDMKNFFEKAIRDMENLSDKEFFDVAKEMGYEIEINKENSYQKCYVADGKMKYTIKVNKPLLPQRDSAVFFDGMARALSMRSPQSYVFFSDIETVVLNEKIRTFSMSNDSAACDDNYYEDTQAMVA
jgi:hypothetical protein